MKLVRLIKMCSNGTCNKVRTGKTLTRAFPTLLYYHFFSTLL